MSSTETESVRVRGVSGNLSKWIIFGNLRFVLLHLVRIYKLNCQTDVLSELGNLRKKVEIADNVQMLIVLVKYLSVFVKDNEINLCNKHRFVHVALLRLVKECQEYEDGRRANKTSCDELFAQQLLSESLIVDAENLQKPPA